MFINKSRGQKGVSLYFAVVISSLLMAIALGLTTILIGQIKILKEMGDSVKAIFAADSGMEKIIYLAKECGKAGCGATWSGICNANCTGFATDPYSTSSQPGEWTDANTSYTAAASSSGPVCPTATDIDGNSYNAALIGGRCWMNSNLKVTRNPLGAAITRYCFNDNPANCNGYGGLYSWSTAMNGSASCDGTGEGQPACAAPVQGICPSGWHMPSHYEWTLLERSVCTSASCVTDFPYDEITTGWRGTNEGTTLKSGCPTCFNGILAGYRNLVLGSYSDLGLSGYFWASTARDINNNWSRALYSDRAQISRSYFSGYGFSVRCLYDSTIYSGPPTIFRSKGVYRGSQRAVEAAR